MRRFYNTHRKIFYSFFFLLFLATGLANAQPFTFTYEDACVPSPACAEDGTVFKEDDKSTATAWAWVFGDGGTGDVRNPLHSYKTAGTYTVTLTRTFANGPQTIETQQITIGEVPPPFQQWKSDTTICPNTSLVLDPYPGGAPAGAKYIWYPKGDTTQTLEVDSSGCYSVEVIMPNGCKLQDRVNVKICMEPANQEGAKWFFGGNAGLDFSSTPPAPITDGKVNTPEGTSSIANSKGVLLFYSDGITVWDKDGGVMPCVDPANCKPLLGSKNSTQSVLIVPQPTCKGCEYLFNVFTTSDINGEKLLTVSVVDMRKNNGKGAIVDQNTTLQKPTTERVAAVQNKRDSTYWVISHDYGTNKFRIFHATTGGLSETSSPELGMAHDSLNKGEGYMKFSAPDTTSGERQLAVIIPGPPTNYVELFKFNDSTGVLTYNKTINLGPAPPTAYGIEFSPSGEKMYVSFQGSGSSKSYLKQYDLTFGDSLIVESAIIIDSSATQKFGALQIAPDGKIYMAIEGSDYLATIGKPERNSVSAIEYKKDGVNLGGKKSQLGLPSMVQDFTQEASGPGFSADGFCTNEPTNFEAGPICDPLKDNMYIWTFGDGSGGSSKEPKISHTYTQPGSYLVSLSQSNACTSIVTRDTIVIYETPPQIRLGADTSVCMNSFSLDMGVPAQIYEWYNRGRIIGRSRVLPVTVTGRYIAVAYNGPDRDCFSSDTIEVTLRKPPPFELGDTTLCRDSSVVLLATGLTWNEWKWSTGETTQSITVNKPGTYFVQVKNRLNCYNADTLVVTELPTPVLRLEPEYYICIPDGGSTTLDSRGTGVLKYEWPHSGETTQAVVVNKEGTYTVLGTNAEGCVAKQSTKVIDQCEPRFFIPDAFTPDGDGKNENLDVFGAYYINYSIRVYNRWGEVIYATNSIEDKWDGTYKGVKVQPGVYPYVVSYEAEYFPERNPVVLRGSVMVIR